jgi:site-specific recombinase XerD
LGKLKDIVKRAELPGKWSLHKFRRTFATNALANGVPIHVVQEWMGHYDLTQLKRYAAKIEMEQPKYRNYANQVAQAVKV